MYFFRFNARKTMDKLDASTDDVIILAINEYG